MSWIIVLYLFIVICGECYQNALISLPKITQNILWGVTSTASHSTDTSCVHLSWSVLSGAGRASTIILWVSGMNDRLLWLSVSSESTHVFPLLSVFVSYTVCFLCMCTCETGADSPVRELALINWACSESSYNSIAVHIATKLVCVNLALLCLFCFLVYFFPFNKILTFEIN